MIIFAAEPSQGESFPLIYQIACIILTALFLWSFSIARDPRGWRRLYQAKFVKHEDFSVNKNKKIDEAMKKWGILIAMMFLVSDVSCFVLGVTFKYRNNPKQWTKDDMYRAQDVDKVKGDGSGGAAKRALGGG